MAAARKYLVTGGAGFIGSALVKRLLGEGHQVAVLDNFSRGKHERLAGLPCDVFEGDVTSYRATVEASHGCDAIIHLAYLQGTQTFYVEPRQVLTTALSGMESVLRSCETNGIGELLLVSSSEAYQVASVVPTPETIPLTVPDPLNPRYSYGGGKIVCEIMANAWHRNGVLDRVIIARPHNIIGPDMGREHVIPEFALRMNRLHASYAANEIIPFAIQGTGQETRSFCYIDDCTGQLAALLDHAPVKGIEIYNVGVEDERSIAEVAKWVAACYERQIKVIPGKLPEGSPPRRLPDTRKIHAFYHEPEVHFTDSVKWTVRWYQDYG